MSAKRKFQDPDFGTIEVPEDAFPSKQEWEERKARLATIAQRRIWAKGSITKCPACAKKALVGRDDLVEEIVRPGQVHSFRHLRGARCTGCGSQFLEPTEIIDIEREVGVGMVADFEAKVSNIGSGTLGTYWPKDVVRNMSLSPAKKVFIRIIDRDTALVRFSRSTEPRKRRPTEPMP